MSLIEDAVKQYVGDSPQWPRGGDDNYASLSDVLDAAWLQAATGKGRERHGQDLPFEDQPMQKLIQLYGPGFAAGQIGKKTQEALRLDTDRAIQELLGVIVYAAGLIVHMEREGRAATDSELPQGRA